MTISIAEVGRKLLRVNKTLTGVALGDINTIAASF